MKKIINGLQNLVAKFARFMADRYARVDAISITCVIASIILDLIGGFFGFWGYFVLSFVSFSITVYAIYRPFSKNVWKREKENRRYNVFLKSIKDWFLLNYRRVRNIRTAVFVKCPNCKAVIRFPRKKGEHMARCPRCGERFKVNVRF